MSDGNYSTTMAGDQALMEALKVIDKNEAHIKYLETALEEQCAQNKIDKQMSMMKDADMIDNKRFRFRLSTGEMQGHKVSRGTSKNPALFDKYQCPYCNHLLKDAVQSICGHWLCECCADELLAESLPKCPKLDCQEFLKSDEEGAECFPDRCVRKEIEEMIVGCPQGCQWEGRLAKLEAHLKACNVLQKEHNLLHGRVCPKALMNCPLTVQFGYHHTRTKYMCAVELEKPHMEIDPQQATDKVGHREYDGYEDISDEGRLNELAREKVASETESQLKTIEQEKSQERSRIEKSDDKTRPSPLVEMNMHNEWKITQFSQKLTDAHLGKCLYVLSLPFYTGRYGYKMCLRLYILGDVIGKNTHMSLFFVIMKGDFDDILKWPFTSKVTFKLINQTGNRDIIDTFQPDPTSSSFQKPKSDMNIASGCPLFVLHSELGTDGFIVDNTICINCCVSPPSTMN